MTCLLIGVRHQRVFDILARRQHRLLVDRHGLLRLGLGGPDLAPHVAQVKNTPRYCWPRRPIFAAARKPIADRETLEASDTGQGEFREQLGCLHADIGGVRCQFALGTPRTSGRRRSKSDGSPTGTSGGGAGIGAACDNSANNASGSWPMSTPNRCTPCLSDVSRTGICARVVAKNHLGLLCVQFATEACLETGTGDLHGILLRRNIFVRDGKPLLKVADFNIIAGHLPQELLTNIS